MAYIRDVGSLMTTCTNVETLYNIKYLDFYCVCWHYVTVSAGITLLCLLALRYCVCCHYVTVSAGITLLCLLALRYS